jgi:hypothetical protein
MSRMRVRALGAVPVHIFNYNTDVPHLRRKFKLLVRRHKIYLNPEPPGMAALVGVPF